MRFHPHAPPVFAVAIQYPCCVPAAVLGSSTRVPPATGTTLDPLARRNVAGDLLRTVAGSRTLSRNTEASRARKDFKNSRPVAKPGELHGAPAAAGNFGSAGN